MCEESMTFVSDEEIVEALVDEFRVLYSKDCKKLLKTDNKELLEYRVEEGTEIICEEAFQGAQLISIELPESLIAIGPRAFHHCESLTSVMIPDNVVNVWDSAFSRCSSLGAATLGKSVASIEGSSFMFCPSLSDIFVSAENEHYRSVNGVLYTKEMRELVCYPAGKSLDDFVFPESVTKIGEYAFSGYRAWGAVTVKGSIAVLGEHAFSGCDSLISVTIGNGVKEIGRSAFGMCKALTSLSIGDGLSAIGEYAFCNCPLTCVEIPCSVRKIEAGVFYRCESLTSVTIPASLAYIGEAAFGLCTKLERIVSLNPLPPTMEFDAFQGVDKKSCVLAVPVGSKQGYASADYWGEFENIEELKS